MTSRATPRITPFAVLSVCMIGLVSCGSSPSPSGSSPSPSSSSTSPSGSTIPAGSGTVSGTAGGHATTSVAAAYFIGQSDDPNNTIVIYLFDTAVACQDIAAPGWDAKIRDKTGALEMKLFGTTAGTYPVSVSPTGATGQASVNFTVSSTSATPVEGATKSGTVTLDSIDKEHAKGQFDLTFADGTLKGTFDALWCAVGHEP